MHSLKRTAEQRLPRVYRRLREWKFAMTSKLFVSRTVQHIYGGQRFKIQIADPLARDWYDHDWARLGEIELLSQYGLRPGARVFDLGAHQNVVALMLAHETGPSGQVIAVEGAAQNCEIGRTNVTLNGMNNIVTLHAVVAEQEGEIAFSASRTGSVSVKKDEFLTTSVRAVTIDGLAREFGPPDVVFMDIEGYEIAALRGARQTLATRAIWFIEVHGDARLAMYGSKGADVLDFFPDAREFYYRSDENLPFVPLTGKDSVPTQRFFLVVVPKS